MRRFRSFLCAGTVLLLIAAALLTGCAKTATKQPEPTTGTNTTTSPKQITVALVPKLVHPFFEDCRIGGDKKAKELGVKFEWVAPPSGDPAVQVRMIEDLVAKKVDAIAISPNEPKSAEPVIADAIAKGIKVITFDADSPDSKRIMYIGTDNKAAGVQMGETMAKLVGGKGEVAIITGGLGALNLNQRIEGVKEALKKYPDMKLVDTQGTDDDLARASRWPRRCSGPARIWSASSASAPPAARRQPRRWLSLSLLPAAAS
jgi:ribose transport system substrate-binding protein